MRHSETQAAAIYSYDRRRETSGAVWTDAHPDYSQPGRAVATRNRYGSEKFRVTSYVVPTVLVVLWFVISPYVVSMRVLRYSFALRGVLLVLLTMDVLQKGRRPPMGMLPWVIAAGVAGDVQTGGMYVGTAKYAFDVLVSNIGLLILLSLHLISLNRLARALRVLVLFVTVTVALMGLYQLYQGQLIGDFSEIADTGAMLSIETGRLCGLPYPSANQSGVALLLALGIILGRLLTRPTVPYVALFCVNCMGLVLTYSRGGYIGFAVIVALVLFLAVRKRPGIRGISTGVVVGGVMTVLAVIVVVTQLKDTVDPDRLANPGTLLTRLELYAGAVRSKGNAFIGQGLARDLSDASETVTSSYITPHNFFLGWTVRFGWLPGLVLLGMLLAQMKRMAMYTYRGVEDPDQMAICTGIALALVGIVVASLSMVDSPYFVLLASTLSAAYLNDRRTGAVPADLRARASR